MRRNLLTLALIGIMTASLAVQTSAQRGQPAPPRPADARRPAGWDMARLGAEGVAAFAIRAANIGRGT